ncbi:hypothetical protein D046_0107A, partial [Vibrio parahaemolyticus V-223/04]
MLLVTTAIFFSVCYYAINSIVKHNYLDSALDIADSLS